VWPEVIHTVEIDVTVVPTRSDNNGVDVDCVDKWLGRAYQLGSAVNGASPKDAPSSVSRSTA
jgi:hypothetical protein